MKLHLKWGVVDLTVPIERRYCGVEPEYRRVLEQVRLGGWGFSIGSCDPLGFITVARLEVDRG